MSIVAPVTSGVAPAFSVILFVIFLGQSLSKIEAYAIAGVIVGVTLSGVRFAQLKKDILRTGFSLPNSTIDMKTSQTAKHGDHEKARRLVKGLDFAFLCSASTAVVYLGLGILIPRLGWFFPALILKGAGAFVTFAFLMLAGKKFKIPDKRTSLLLLLMGIMDVGGLLVFNYGISIAENLLPLVITFSGLSGLVILICAYVVYHERLEPIQAVGIFLVITAASILLYFQ
jgi:drug/metabolite transporter (DMT)-like permease